MRPPRANEQQEINAQNAQQYGAEQAQQAQEPQTLIERSKKACKTVTYFLGAWTALGVVIQFITGNWGSIFTGIVQMIVFWVIAVIGCFTVYPWALSTFGRSVKMGEQFWKQKF